MSSKVTSSHLHYFFTAMMRKFFGGKNFHQILSHYKSLDHNIICILCGVINRCFQKVIHLNLMVFNWSGQKWKTLCSCFTTQCYCLYSMCSIFHPLRDCASLNQIQSYFFFFLKHFLWFYKTDALCFFVILFAVFASRVSQLVVFVLLPAHMVGGQMLLSTKSTLMTWKYNVLAGNKASTRAHQQVCSVTKWSVYKHSELGKDYFRVERWVNSVYEHLVSSTALSIRICI